MSKYLTNEMFPEQLDELRSMDFDISQNRGCPILETTKRNKIRVELMEGLKNVLEDMLVDTDIANVFMTGDGIAVELENRAVAEKVPDGNGTIVMVVDITFKNLVYDAYAESMYYEEEQEIKAAKAAKRVAGSVKTSK